MSGNWILGLTRLAERYGRDGRIVVLAGSALTLAGCLCEDASPWSTMAGFALLLLVGAVAFRPMEAARPNESGGISLLDWAGMHGPPPRRDPA